MSPRLPRAAALLLLLAGCAQPVPMAAIPDRPVTGAADPTHQAVFGAAYVFADPGRVAGRPADAARAAADLEWMTVALPQDQRWIGARQVLFGQLRDARTELRGVLGIPQDATPASAADRLHAAARALDAGRRAEAVTALGSEAALTRLEALPYMPRVAQATNVAQSELGRLMGDDPTGGSG